MPENRLEILKERIEYNRTCILGLLNAKGNVRSHKNLSFHQGELKKFEHAVMNLGRKYNILSCYIDFEREGKKYSNILLLTDITVHDAFNLLTDKYQTAGCKGIVIMISEIKPGEIIEGAFK